MNRALYILGIVLSIVFMIVCAFYVIKVDVLRSIRLLDFSGGNLSLLNKAMSLTLEVGYISIFFFSFFIIADLLGVLQVKTKTMKILGIIGMFLGVSMLVWDLVMISSPSHISFDEIGGVFILYALATLAFSIVGLIQSIHFSRLKKTKNGTVFSDYDLLDS